MAFVVSLYDRYKNKAEKFEVGITQLWRKLQRFQHIHAFQERKIILFQILGIVIRADEDLKGDA